MHYVSMSVAKTDTHTKTSITFDMALMVCQIIQPVIRNHQYYRQWNYAMFCYNRDQSSAREYWPDTNTRTVKLKKVD